MTDTLFPIVRIDRQYWQRHYWTDAWRFRRIMLSLTWVSLLNKYRYAVLGCLWILLKPILTFAVFYLVFGKIMNTTQTPHFAPMVLCGVLVWQLFNTIFAETSNTLKNYRHLIRSCYFPRVLFMGSSVLLSLIEFLVYFSICLLFSPWIGLTFSLKWGLIPFILLIITMTHTSFGMFMSLWVARYEDVKIITPFFIQLLMFVSPVGYSTMLVPEAWRGLYSLNPLVGNIELMRWLLCPSSYDVYWPSIVWSAAFSVGAFLLSLFRIIQAEGRLADEI